MVCPWEMNGHPEVELPRTAISLHPLIGPPNGKSRELFDLARTMLVAKHGSKGVHDVDLSAVITIRNELVSVLGKGVGGLGRWRMR